MTLPTLVGKHCVLRELRVEDAPSLSKNADNDAVWRNLFDGFPRPYTLTDAQAWCNPSTRPAAVGHVWGITRSDKVIGCVGLRPDAGWLRCNAEVGYWIGEAHWRLGITSEALGLVTAWAWAELPELTRIYAPIFSWNDGSQAVAAKQGYVLEARLPQSAIKDGRVIDRVQYAAYRKMAAQK
jgi:[ribosomal protein S5]-alanine N-acetyltransferase